MNKRTFLKFLPIILAIVILLPLGFSSQALGWSAVVINRTHKDIADYAYGIVSSDLAFKSVKFPLLPAIEDADYVNTDRTGTGPDVMGRTNGGAHFYNPRLEGVQGELAASGAGGGIDTVKDEFVKLVTAMSNGNSANATHAASWVAHFISDLCMPYHTQGTYRADILKRYNDAGGRNATAVPLPSYITGPLSLSGPFFYHGNDFKLEIEAFIRETQQHADTEDWFDPWYWDGIVDDMLQSSHVVYEGTTFTFPGTWLSFFTQLDISGGVQGYSSLWRNPAPSFDNPVGKQAAQVREFAWSTAKVTLGVVDNLGFSVGSPLSSATTFLESSIQSAATVWRASFSALVPSITFSIPDKTKPNKFKVTGTVANMAGERVLNVQLKLTVTGGTIISGDQSPDDLDSIDSNVQESYTWEVEAAPLGYCTFKMEVIGLYYDTPDLQYAVTSVTAPGILPVSTSTNTNATRGHSIVFCLDNSQSMDGQPIIDAMDAGVQAVNAAQSGLAEMALYFFGTNECDPPVRVVNFTLDRDKITAAMNTASARGYTPLAAAITAAGEYIRSSAQGQEATIILLTDGKETCNGDPIAAARALNPSLKLKTSRSWFATPAYASNNIPISLQVVGFNITEPDIEATLQQIALAGNGKYYSATGLQQLVDALTTVVKEATDKGSGIQVWWYVAGGAAFLLLLITLLRRGRHARVPVNTMASTSVHAPVTSPPQGTRRPAVSPPMSVLFCPRCGSRVQVGAAFCTGCGSPVALAAKPVTAPPESSQTYCTQCGFQNAAGSAFCGKCGSSLNINKQNRVMDAVSQPNLTYCPQCGAPSAVGSVFCNKCGNSLTMNIPYPATGAVAPRNSTYCPQCGAPNDVGSTFCNKCGSSMTLQPTESVPAYQQPQAFVPKTPSPFWWFLPFFLGVIGGLIAWLALKDKNRDMAKRLLITSIAWTVLMLGSYLSSTI
jgi:Mg-chelatase subunit ChlD/ribosomal protein L40E